MVAAAYEQLITFLPSAYKEVCYGLKRTDEMQIAVLTDRAERAEATA